MSGFHLRVSLALILMQLSGAPAQSQPSGGPYGPVQRNYEIPQDAAHVYYVAPEADEDNSGESLEKPTTLDAAIARCVTGDAIILRGGTYRTGNLEFNQGITLQPYRDEQPVIKGTRVATDWQRLQNGIWRTRWDALFPLPPQDWWRREREVMRTPMYRFNNDMVFVDGKMLSAVGWAGEITADSYWIDYEQGYVYIGVDPTDKLVEITAHDCALLRTIGEVHGKKPDKLGVKVRGITFTQFAYRAIEIEGRDPEGVSPESEHGKDVVGSTFEDCTISYCSRVAGYFRGDDLVIRRCLVDHTSTEGIYVLSSNDVLLEKNIVTNNNMEQITGYYVSAVKIFNQCYRVTCRDNLVIDNPAESSGIWYDVGNVDGVFVNNMIVRTDNGFFFEISKNALCAGNVFVDCGTGIQVRNSSNVEIVHNTLVNSTAQIRRDERSAVGDHFGWHPATGPDVDQREGHKFSSNLLVADDDFDRPLLDFLQAPGLRDQLRDPQVALLDNNVYVSRSSNSDKALIHWSPGSKENGERYRSSAALHDVYPKFADHSLTLTGYHGPLFRGEELMRFELDPDFPGGTAGAKPTESELRALRWQASQSSFPGAFPPVESAAPE